MASTKKRVGMLDDLRGIAIIAMVLYHLFYDLVFIFGVNIPVFSGDLVNTLRDITAGLFMVISGIACHYSKNNLKRGIVTLGCGLLLSLVTYLFMPSQFIVFGVLHCLGCCMILYGFIGKGAQKIPPIIGFIVTLFLFISLRFIDDGIIGISGLWQFSFQVPAFFGNTLAPLGFPGRSFASADYYPIIPWFLLYLSGSYLGFYVNSNRFPQFFYKSHSKFLSNTGKKSLLIYLLHQPIIYGILYVIFTYI